MDSFFKAFSFYRETNCCKWFIGESTLVIIGEYNADDFSRFIGEQTVELQANHPSHCTVANIATTEFWGPEASLPYNQGTLD